MKAFATLSLAASALVFAACSTTHDSDDGEHSEEHSEEHGEHASHSADTDGTVWRSLFDGETTAGWVNYNQDTISDGWKVVDGALTMTGGGGDIVTVDEFESFELELEWNIVENGNSGIFYNVTDGQDAVWRSGIEMQVLHNELHYDGKNPLTSAGSCYALYQPVRDVTKAPGEWNSVRLLNKDGHVQHWLNGAMVCEYTIGSDEWNALVASSKFKDMPLFAKSHRGRLALQDHGDWVAYRNIRIREL